MKLLLSFICLGHWHITHTTTLLILAYTGDKKDLHSEYIWYQNTLLEKNHRVENYDKYVIKFNYLSITETEITFLTWGQLSKILRKLTGTKVAEGVFYINGMCGFVDYCEIRYKIILTVVHLYALYKF